MNFSGKNIIAGFVLVLVLVVSVFLVYDLLKKPALRPLDVVPLDAQVLAISKHPEKLLDTWAVSPVFKENNKKLRQIGSIWKMLDSLMNHDVRFEERLANTECCFSMHAMADLKTGVLGAVSEEHGFEASNLRSFLSKKYSDHCAVSRTEDAEKIYAIVFSNFETVLYLSEIQGVVLLSFEKELIKRSIAHVKSKAGAISLQKGFQKVSESTRAKSDASIYINYAHVLKLPHTYSKENYKEEINLFDSFASWSELDLTAKPDKILLSGYTYADDSLQHYLSCIKGQKAQPILAKSIAPSGLSFFMSFSISDAQGWLNQQGVYQQVHNPSYQKEVLNGLQRKYGIKSDRSIAPWLGNEVFIGGNNKGFFYSLHLKDRGQAQSKLKAFAQNSGSQAYSKKYGAFVIGKIDIENLLYPVIGSLAEGGPYYYAVIGDFAILSTKQKALKHLIDNYNNGNVLEKSNEFLKLSESLAERANVTACIFNPDFITTFMHQEFNELLLANTWITKFGGLGLQLIEKGEFVYTSLYSEYESESNPSSIYLAPVVSHSTGNGTNATPAVENVEEIPVQVVVNGLELEKKTFGKPFIVETHKSSKDCILTFDEGGKAYYFDHNDKLLWSLQLDGTPLSQVYEVDALRNGKVQYLFNTAQKIYLLDVKGRHVKGFPVKVPSGAAGPISLMDYSNNRKYRIFVGGKDKVVYNFDINGKHVKGWKKPKALAPIVAKAEHLVFNKKDHLIFPDEAGNALITDRKGNQRIRIKSKLNHSKNSGFWLNKTNSKGNILTSDKEGRLTYIASDGKLRNTVFGVFSPEHYFFYEDFSRNGSKDFIYIDQTKLLILDKYKKIILEFTFENPINIQPQIFKKGTQLILAVTDAISGKVYFFNKNGLIKANSGIMAVDQLSLGTITSGKWEVISTSGNKVIRSPWK